MKTCPSCNHKNIEGELFCAECGQVLSTEHAAILATRRLSGAAGNASPQDASGTARLGKSARVILQIRSFAEPVVLEPQDEITIGRADPSSKVGPTLDLTPFDAQEQGVSRLHAAILWGDDTLSLVDKASSNGTYLNGQAVEPNRPRILRDGDEIRFGLLVCHIYFK